MKKVEVKPGGSSSTPAEWVEPQVNVTPAPTHSLLDLLADQALAREKPFSLSQELLAAAVAKYKRSVQNMSFVVDSKSPPFPPPPPQSSPVGFPVSGVCQVVPSKLLQIGDLTKRVDAGEVYVISDDDPDDPVPWKPPMQIITVSFIYFCIGNFVSPLQLIYSEMAEWDLAIQSFTPVKFREKQI